MMGAVFAMQGFGQFAAAIVALIVTAGFKESLETASSVGKCSGVCQLAVDKMWRVVIGFGAVPACIALYYRLTIPETPRYTFDVARDILKADEDVRAYIAGKREGHPDEVRRASVINNTADLIAPKASWADFWRHYSQWKNGSILLGTAGSWFFLDVGKFFFFLPVDPAETIDANLLQPSTVLVSTTLSFSVLSAGLVVPTSTRPCVVTLLVT